MQAKSKSNNRFVRPLLLAAVLTAAFGSSAYAESTPAGVQTADRMHVETGGVDVAYNDNGDIWYWGGSPNGSTPVRVGQMKDIAQVYPGGLSMFVKKDGTVWSWMTSPDPNRSYSEKGKEPQQLPELHDVSRFEAGFGFQAAMLKDGTVWVWVPIPSLSSEYAAGHGKPVKLEGVRDAVSIAQTNNKLIILKKDGTVWQWNKDTSIPNLLNIDPAKISQIEGFSNVASIAVQSFFVGQDAVLALKKDGTVWGWGSNDLGRIGLKEHKFYDVAEPIPGLRDVAKVISGGYGQFAIKKDGSVLSWGTNTGQLGLSEPEIYEPTPVPGLKDVVDIVADIDFSSVLKKDGTVWTLGPNNVVSGGRLESNPTSFPTEPKRVEGLKDVVAIAGSFSHTVAVKKDGTVWTWGVNSSGQLGDGTTTSRTNPIQVKLD